MALLPKFGIMSLAQNLFITLNLQLTIINTILILILILPFPHPPSHIADINKKIYQASNMIYCLHKVTSYFYKFYSTIDTQKRQVNTTFIPKNSVLISIIEMFVNLSIVSLALIVKGSCK